MLADQAPVWGLYRSEVVRTDDPQQRGRLLLRIPQVLGEAMSDWAEPSDPPASLPTVGDPVWVQFSGGDVTKPVYQAYGGGTVEIPDVGGPTDTLAPKGPTALSASTGYDLSSEGNSSAWVVATWIAPTENADGTPLNDLHHYDVRWSYDNATWTPAGAAMDTTTRLDRLRTGVRVYVNVRSVDKVGNASLWQAYDLVTASASDPLPAPSVPAVNSRLSGIQVSWDGLNNLAAPYPTNLLRVEVHRGPTSTFLVSDATLVTAFAGPGAFIDSSVSFDSTYYYRLVAVNKVFVRSTPSIAIAGTARRAVSDDLSDNLITAAKIVDQAISAPKVGFTIGGGNLLPNPSFEGDVNLDGIPDSWVAYAAGAPVTPTRDLPLVSTRGVTHGSTALHLKMASGVLNDRVGISTPNSINLAGTGRPHVLSVDVDNPSAANLVVQIDYRTSADALISSESLTVTPASAAGRYTKALTVPASAAKCRVFIYLNALGAVTNPEAWIDSIQLEQGQVATAFSPSADEILDASITNAKILNIDAGKVTTGYLDVANRIQAGAIDALKIATNSLTATQILAGSITGDRLAASTVTTQNLDVQALSDNMISNGDMETLVPDGTRPAEWQNQWSQGPVTLGVETVAPISGTRSLKVTLGDATATLTALGSNSKIYSVKPGETYFVRASAKASRAIPGKVVSLNIWTSDDRSQIWALFRSGTASTAVASAEMTGDIQMLSGTFTVPDGQYFMTPALWCDPSGDGSGYTLLWDDVELYKQVTSVKIANGAVTASHLMAGSVTADKLVSELVLAGSIKTATIGSRIELDDDSLRIFDTNGVLTALFPTDADLSNQFLGSIFANGITVNDGLSVRGVNNEFSTGSTTSLKSSVTTSGVPPTVTLDYPSVAFNPYLLDGRAGIYWDGANYYTAYSLFGAGLTQITPAGVATSVGFDKNGSNNVLGLTKIGTTWYVLAEAGYGRLSGVYVYAYNAAWVKTAEWLYAAAMPKFKPSIGTNGTQLLIGQVTDPGLVTIKVYSTTGVLSSTLSSTHSLSRDLSGVAFGTFDYGANRYLVSTKITGSASQVYSYTVSGTTLTLQANEAFPGANSEAIGGLHWDGTSILSLSKDTGKIYKYTGNKWTTESAVWWASFSWRQSTGGWVTTQSARAKFTMKKRARLTLSVPPIPVTGDPSDPDAVAFYLARGASDPGRASSFQQTLPAVGARSSILTSAVFTGTNPPPSTTFPNAKPASVESTKAGVNGPLSKMDADGTVRAQTLAVGDVTSPATGGVTASGPVTLTSTTDASSAAGNAPPLRIGDLAGVHLRVDGNEIIAMAGDAVLGNLIINEGVTVYADGSAQGQSFRALSTAEQPKVIAGGSLTSTSSATYSAITGAAGDTFVAPSSGRIMVHLLAFLRSGTAGVYSAVGFDLRTGSTIGSGTQISAPGANEQRIVNANTAWIKTGGSFYVGGLVAGSTYNIRPMMAVGSGTGSVDASQTIITIQPLH